MDKSNVLIEWQQIDLATKRCLIQAYDMIQAYDKGMTKAIQIRRLPDLETLSHEVQAWQQQRNA